MIAIILDLIAEKNRVWKNDLPSLSYRYAALKVRGCDPGDRVLGDISWRTSTGRAPALYSS